MNQLTTSTNAYPNDFSFFDPHTAVLDWRGVVSAAQLCNLSYRRKLLGAPLLRAAGYQLEWLLTKYVEGVVAIRDDHCFIVFRGSDNLDDWQVNFSSKAVRQELLGAKCHVHQGFWQSSFELWPQVQDALRDFSGKICLAGHSLGGAKALLTACLLEDAGVSVDSVLSFGAPRAADAELAARLNQRFEDRFLRFVSQEDIVPELPSKMMHGGREVHFNAHGKIGPKSSLVDANVSAAKRQMPLLFAPWDRSTFENWRKYYDEHKDGLWEDMSDRLGGTIFASTAPWVRFHDMRYYLSLVLDQWREAENG